MIAIISYGHHCLREENLSFNKKLHDLELNIVIVNY
jgi:hypothetical protein